MASAGATLIWVVARTAVPVNPLLGGWIGMTGLIFVLHFAGAIAIGRLLESLLFGVSGRDPRILAFSACLLGLSAAVAAAIPAARAARIDPIRALRIE